MTEGHHQQHFMSRKYLLLFSSLLSLSLFSCHPDNNITPRSLLIGNWTLQQQHAVQIIDGVKHVDTVYNASATTYGNIVFNKDNTCSSASVYRPGNYLLNADPGGSSESKGTYSLSGNTFTAPPGISGWFFYATGSSTTPVSTSNPVQITKLTASNLALHTDNSVTVTYNSASHTIEIISDFYYTR